MSKGWIGVDLDGTLAHYDEWRGLTHIGEPIPYMVERVKDWKKKGYNIKIFTARVCEGCPKVHKAINDWCVEHLGFCLPITNAKDFNMIELWDDRCVTVKENTGVPLTKSQRGLE